MQKTIYVKEETKQKVKEIEEIVGCKVNFSKMTDAGVDVLLSVLKKADGEALELWKRSIRANEIRRGNGNE
jgi:translation elongation factor EF-Tu-like GTPase